MTQEQAIHERVEKYWTNRSSSFLEQRTREFHSPLKARWITEFAKYLPQNQTLKILDIGCGTGFFTGILSQLGHEVIGIDLTKEMIHLATVFAKQEKLLINIDGNYGASSMTDTSHLPQHHAHHHLSQATLSECEMIQRSLSISSEVRPQWDVQYLLNKEVDSLQIDRTISHRIYLEKDEFYNPTPLFLLCAKK